MADQMQLKQEQLALKEQYTADFNHIGAVMGPERTVDSVSQSSHFEDDFSAAEEKPAAVDSTPALLQAEAPPTFKVINKRGRKAADKKEQLNQKVAANLHDVNASSDYNSEVIDSAKKHHLMMNPPEKKKRGRKPTKTVTYVRDSLAKIKKWKEEIEPLKARLDQSTDEAKRADL
jgi:hypothetical protein